MRTPHRPDLHPVFRAIISVVAAVLAIPFLVLGIFVIPVSALVQHFQNKRLGRYGFAGATLVVADGVRYRLRFDPPGLLEDPRIGPPSEIDLERTREGGFVGAVGAATRERGARSVRISDPGPHRLMALSLLRAAVPISMAEGVEVLEEGDSIGPVPAFAAHAVAAALETVGARAEILDARGVRRPDAPLTRPPFRELA